MTKKKDNLIARLRREADDEAAEKVREALESTGWNAARAAGLLGVAPRQVMRWIDRFGLRADYVKARAKELMVGRPPERAN